MRKTITLDSREAEKLIEFMKALVMMDESKEDGGFDCDLSEAEEWERLLVDKLYARID